MKLNENTNYIVSGLERSGTSMLMQMLNAGEIPVAFDDKSRPSDKSNPKGYFELEGGKIINKLIDGTFPFEDYKGKFIKITAYGLKFLPQGNYNIIYSEREMEEILDSMEKMAEIKDSEREETKTTFNKLNNMIKKVIESREDINVLFVNYNKIISDPETNIKQIQNFIQIPDENYKKMIRIVDKRLYRQRRIKKI